MRRCFRIFIMRAKIRLMNIGFKNRNSGQGTIEYGLILGFIAIAVVAVLTLMSGQLQNFFSQIVASLTSIGGGA